MPVPQNSSVQAMNAQVLKAAAVMDELLPGWERTIDVAHLDIGDVQDCVAGQAFRSDEEVKGFVELVYFLRANGKKVLDYPAFLLPSYRDAWIALIKMRFETGVFSDSDQEEPLCSNSSASQQ